ncbi:BMC domain-containing protein [Clostridium sp. ATCC 25772]|uniref:BMC domain-containing protein n=1 Tax=Clostridium sp. ATCC 25772 TaxID=1676991 RepID=UPI0007850859|nr:BMC domain-containing protein [Clostridium sp. ATCC 25772]
MQALGFIETRGLLTAIEAADTMAKSADVSIVEKTYIGGGLVTIVVTGDVGAVKAAIEAGGAAVKNIDEESLISEHVIPRPHEELESIIGPNTSKEILEVPSSNKEDGLKEIEKTEEKITANVEDTEEHVEKAEKAEMHEDKLEEQLEKNQEILETDSDKLHKMSLQNLHKDDIDNLINKDGIEKTILMLSKLKVVKLRNLAREYDDFVIRGRAISKADKNLLITKFKTYYEKN